MCSALILGLVLAGCQSAEPAPSPSQPDAAPATSTSPATESSISNCMQAAETTRAMELCNEVDLDRLEPDLERLVGQVADLAESGRRVHEAQAAWRTYVEKECRARAWYQRGSQEGVVYGSCLVELTAPADSRPA